MQGSKPSLFGTSGIRGVVNVDLDPILVMKVGLALGKILKNGRLAVARDTRTSSEMLASSLMAGILAGGLEVTDLGVLPTPALAYLTRSLGAESGAMITASHNPPEFNGVKLFDKEGKAYAEFFQRQVELAVSGKEFSAASWSQLKGVSSYDFSFRYMEMILGRVKFGKAWKVALDLGSGAAYKVVFDLFRSLDCRVISLNAQPDGFFPGRSSELTIQSLATLMTVVRNMGCDIGVAFDGDADRVSFVDDSGRFIEGDVALAAFASNEVKRHGGGTVALPVDSSLAVQEAVEKGGGNVVWTKVGDPYVAEAIVREGAIFGGEPSGAWVHPDFHLCPDGILSSVLMLRALEERGISARELFSGIVTYPMRRGKIPCENRLKVNVMKAVASDLPGALGEKPEVTDLDGIRVQVPSGWVLVRPSGTEPAIRLTVEARTQELAEHLYNVSHRLCSKKMGESLS